ncbi:MAG: hypothetical protein DMG79_13670 [Acidobacteria bacterium]|nr:MAG: hypothetical protein DMG79_13670 [Acidobacteriota bacterium]
MLKASLVALVFLALFGSVSLAAAQQIHLPPAIAQGPGIGDVPVKSGNETQKEQARAANLQRQVEIKRDTEKMYQLTAELKEYLEKADQGIMSTDALKKAEQIEKLAHGVKSKMKQSF